MRVTSLTLTFFCLQFLAVGCSASSLLYGAKKNSIYSFEYTSLANSRLEEPKNTSEKSLSLSISSLKVGWQKDFRFLQNGTLVQQSVSYRIRQIQYKDPQDSVATNEEIEQLHAFKYKVAFKFPLTTKWSIITAQQLGIFSDEMSSLGRSDLRFEGSLIVNNKLSDTRHTSLGVIYTSSFGEPKILPYIGYSNRKINRRIEIAFPSHLSYRNQVNSSMRIGFSVRVNGNKYRIHKKNSPIDTLEYSTITFGPALEFILKSDFSVRLDLGWTYQRKFTSNSGGINQGDLDLEREAYIRIGLRKVL